MTIELITGHAGSAHVSSEDVGLFNAGVFGTGKYVLHTKMQLACGVQSANLVTIAPGDALFEGRHVRVSSTENVAIDNGAQGVNRNDIVCIKYEYDSGTGVESASLDVVKGTATSGTPTDPTIPSGSILQGASAAYMPLYRIPVRGISLNTPQVLYEGLSTLDDALYGYVTTDRLSGMVSESRIPDLGDTYLKREPSGTSELPQNSTSTAYPIVLSNTFANNGEVSYMTVGNFKNAIGMNNLSASDVTSGTFDAARIPNLSASKITSGVLPIERGGTGHSHGLQWVHLTSTSGTTAKTISTSGYEEIMVVCQHGTDYLASAVIPQIALTSTAKELYLGGGYNGSGTNGRAASIRMTTTRAMPQMVMVNSTNVTAEADWQIYAR